MKKKKKRYTTVVVEQPIDAPRAHAWESVLAVAATEPFATHEQLAVEPPWRWVYRADDDQVAFYEGTITIRDDGPTCHLSWSLVLDPLPDSTPDETEAYLSDQKSTLETRCAEIAAAAS